MNSWSDRLKAMGLALPPPPKALASYMPTARTGSLLYVSGQLPMRDGVLQATGPVPSQTSIEEAAKAAERCALHALAAIRDALEGDESRLVRIVKLNVFVQSDPGFGGQPTVANGASDLLARLLGEAGQHARAAVGVGALPFHSSVELELIAEVL